MQRSRESAVMAAGALATALVISACGGTHSSPAATGAGATSNASATANAPAPAATELNPPGDIPDNQAFVAFRPPGKHFVVTVPEGWSRTEAGQAATFKDKLNSIEVVQRAAPTAPTVASVTATDVPRLSATKSNFKLGGVSSVTRTGGTAILVKYQTDSAVDPVTNKVVRDAVEQYTFWKNGREVVLTLSAPQGSDNVDPWRIVTNSFAWTP